MRTGFLALTTLVSIMIPLLQAAVREKQGRLLEREMEWAEIIRDRGAKVVPLPRCPQAQALVQFLDRPVFSLPRLLPQIRLPRVLLTTR